MIISEAERLVSLKMQHIEDTKKGYDGHNRHPVKVSMLTLGSRRARRQWHVWMREWAYTFNTNRLQDSIS